MIEVKNLTRRYGSHLAVDDLNFTVKSGTVYGFLGPNGAGKSTTMNILTGCLAASSGQVTIDGYDIYEEAVEAKKRIGYLPEIPPLYTSMTPREYLTFVAGAKGLRGEAAEEEVGRVMALTGVGEVADRLIAHLSKGFRQRVGIAQALVGDPPIVILDEPTVGLDPLQIIEIRELIRSLGQSHTVILSSHILSEVQAVCDEILMIHRGKLVACDTPAALEARFGGKNVYELTVKASAPEAREALEGLEGAGSLEVEEQPDGRCRVTVEAEPGAADMDEQISLRLAERRIPVLRLEEKKASLEDVFLAMTETDIPAEKTEKKGWPFGRKKEAKDT